MHLIKIFLVVMFFLFGINAYSQDSTRISHIDSIVSSINKLNLQVYKNSSTQKLRDSEINWTIYLTEVFDNGVLKKHQYKMSSLDHENGIYTPFLQSTTFYYDQNQLIKVEKSRLQFEKQSLLEWYFLDDKLLKDTGKDSSLANSFLSNAKEFLERAKWKEKK